jgi:hypothetical protein
MREKRQTTLIEKSNASWERFRTESSYDIMYAARNRNEACALWRKATAAASWRQEEEEGQEIEAFNINTMTQNLISLPTKWLPSSPKHIAPHCTYQTRHIPKRSRFCQVGCYSIDYASASYLKYIMIHSTSPSGIPIVYQANITGTPPMWAANVRLPVTKDPKPRTAAAQRRLVAHLLQRCRQKKVGYIQSASSKSPLRSRRQR